MTIDIESNIRVHKYSSTQSNESLPIDLYPFIIVAEDFGMKNKRKKKMKWTDSIQIVPVFGVIKQENEMKL